MAFSMPYGSQVLLQGLLDASPPGDFGQHAEYRSLHQQRHADQVALTQLVQESELKDVPGNRLGVGLAIPGQPVGDPQSLLHPPGGLLISTVNVTGSSEVL